MLNIIKNFHPKWNIDSLEAREDDIKDLHLLRFIHWHLGFWILRPFLSIILNLQNFQFFSPSGPVEAIRLFNTSILVYSKVIAPLRGNVQIDPSIASL